MKFAYTNIKAFIDLLQNNPEIFNTQDTLALAEKIPENIEKTSECLLAWCKERPEIDRTLKAVRRNLPEEQPTSRGAGGVFPTPETQAVDEKNLREALLNALRQSSYTGNPKPKTLKG